MKEKYSRFADWIKKLTKTLGRNSKQSAFPAASGTAADSDFFSKLWSWILPLLLGLTWGWFVMVLLSVWLGQNSTSRVATVSVAGGGASRESEMMSMGMFLATNPFKITPMEIPDEASTGSGDFTAPIVGSLASAILKGTMPSVGVWLEDQGKLHLVLVGTSFDVYTLEKVNYLRAVFLKEDERVVKELYYTAPPVIVNNKTTPENQQSVTLAGNQVVAADPRNNTEGQISRELVNRLVEDPFTELKNVQIRPSEKEQGLEVRWITKDSVLNQLGVKKGDVVRSVNGIPFKNMQDIMNSMSSLMNSDRFDVDITRDGAATSLKYVVH